MVSDNRHWKLEKYRLKMFLQFLFQKSGVPWIYTTTWRPNSQSRIQKRTNNYLSKRINIYS